MSTSYKSNLAKFGGTALILNARRGPAILTPAYANTLTPLIGTIYTAMETVSRELTGFLPSATRATSVERAAVGQNVEYPLSKAQVANDIVAGMTVPNPADQTRSTGFMTITKARSVEFGLTGEEQRALNTAGSPGVASLQSIWIADALRTLVNEMERDLAVEAAANASRAYGTPGTTPFGSDSIADAAQVKKLLDDNGAPQFGRSLVLNTSAGANLITVKNLTRVNEAGSQMTLRSGELLDLYGMSVKQSGQAVNHTKGTGANATTDNAGYAVGATVITLASAGTGAILANDVITFAGDTNKYVVASGDANVAGGGTITLAAPGLRVAIPAATTAITVGNSYAANVAFSADALHIATRAPALPAEGDAAADRMQITDPFTGVTFDFAVYFGYYKVRYEIGAAWGVKAVKREHIALLQG